MTLALASGSRLSHYHVLSPLGAGGMGEVYLARDEHLERTIALKVLPPDLVKNQERVRRFVQEAKAASSLSHPHIVTIYEIGQAAVDSDGGNAGTTTDAPPLHFIAMEFVSGQTLRQKIHDEQTDLRTLLRWMSQAAEGVAKAHAAGIVHRDLKPENIMITKDGYAKVLDFGLAKLVEQQAPARGTSPTEAPTVEGAVLGTAGYMAPEQVRGRPVDHRADVFSFGCILYEAVARRRPFVADSAIDVMHKILHDEPPPIEDVNPRSPAALSRLIRRCLTKDPEQRLQSMKDLAIELDELVDEFDTLATSSAARRRAVYGASPAPTAGIGLFRAPLWIALVVIAGLAIAVVAWRGVREEPSASDASFQAMRMSRIASVDNLVSGALSPDGKYLATVTGDDELRALDIRQVATGSDLRVMTSTEAAIGGVTFSPDGNYLYYLAKDPDNVSYYALYKVPTLGGTSVKVSFDVDVAVAFAPDGSRMSFVRGYPDRNAIGLIVARLDGSQEREVAIRSLPEEFVRVSPAWSPDGRRIAVVRSSSQGGVRMWLAAIDDADGSETAIGQADWRTIDRVAWIPDDSGLVVVGQKWGDSSRQIWLVSLPRGVARRITNDLNDYVGLAISRDGSSLVTVQSRLSADLFERRLAGAAEARSLGPATSDGKVVDVASSPDGSVIYTSQSEGASGVWRMTREGRRERLSPEDRTSLGPVVAKRTGAVYFTTLDEERSPHVWMTRSGGSEAFQVTRGNGERVVAAAPDGNSIAVLRAEDPGLWIQEMPDGRSRKLTDHLAYAAFSPDGRRLLISTWIQDNGRLRLAFRIAPTDENGPERTLAAPAIAGHGAMRWDPGRDAVTFLRHRVSGSEIWSQPLDGSDPVRIVDLGPERVFDFDWSSDGRSIVYTRGRVDTDFLMIQDWR